MWGCEIYEMPENRMYYNGIDCSGFVSWALLNGGFDPDDIDGGNEMNSEGYDLLDLGETVLLTELDFSKLKAGDLIGYPGHIGMIIGLDDNTIYVAQAYWTNDLEVNDFTYESIFESKWQYVTLMDTYYKEDGNYQAMWNLYED